MSDVEINAVAFLKMIETAFLHFRMMEKQIPPIRFDKSEAAVAHDFLDFPLWHDLAPQKNEMGSLTSRLVVRGR